MLLGLVKLWKDEARVVQGNQLKGKSQSSMMILKFSQDQLQDQKHQVMARANQSVGVRVAYHTQSHSSHFQMPVPAAVQENNRKEIINNNNTLAPPP